MQTNMESRFHMEKNEYTCENFFESFTHHFLPHFSPSDLPCSFPEHQHRTFGYKDYFKEGH